MTQQDLELRPIIDLCAKLEASVDDEVERRWTGDPAGWHPAIPPG